MVYYRYYPSNLSNTIIVVSTNYYDSNSTNYYDSSKTLKP